MGFVSYDGHTYLIEADDHEDFRCRFLRKLKTEESEAFSFTRCTRQRGHDGGCMFEIPPAESAAPTGGRS